MSTLTEAAVDATIDATEQQLQLRDQLLATTATKLGKAYKANAAWRVLAERARKHLAEATHSEDCSRTDECDDADPGECGQCPGPCQPCDCGLAPIQATAAELYAALADPSLGADWVPTGAIGVALSVQSERHRAELRRVAEAVAVHTGEVCGSWTREDVKRLVFDDLDVIVRGTR